MSLRSESTWRLAWEYEGVFREVGIDDQEGSIYLYFGNMGAGGVSIPVDSPETVVKLGGMLKDFGKSRKRKIEVKYVG